MSKKTMKVQHTASNPFPITRKLNGVDEGAFMNHQEYTFARRALISGSHVVIATVPLSEQRIRIIQLRTKGGQYQGKYLNDGKWYPVYRVEIQP